MLVATDCEVQWGADNPGPATVTLKGTQLDVQYEEFQSSDRCETYVAKVSLTGPKLTVTAHSRTVGTVEKGECHLENQSATVDPLGDGSRDHPLLTLHR